MGRRLTKAPEALRDEVEPDPGRDLPGLLSLLGSGDIERRRRAARDLARHPSAALALGAQLQRETALSVRQALLTSLQTLASESAAGALLPLLRSEDAQLRNSTIEALGSMPKAVGPRVAMLLRDADSGVRLRTVSLLGDLPHPQVGAWLLQVLKHEADINVVAAAVQVLAEVGEPADAAALRAVTRRFRGNDLIALAVDRALERTLAL